MFVDVVKSESPRVGRYNRFVRDSSASRSRTLSCSRSRGRRDRDASRSRSRSPSGNVDEGQRRLEQMLNEQQEYIKDLISNHKEEVDELLASKTKSFRSKGLEKQFEFNNKVTTRLSKIKKLLRKKKISRATDAVKELLEICEDHADDLLVADSSRHGWLTVHQLRGGTLSSDLWKKVEKIDNRLDKARPKDGKNRPQASGGNSNRMENQNVQTWRRKQGPEEAMQSYSKVQRQGTCTHCSAQGHFYRECPDFWRDVNASRKKASQSGTST